MFLFLRRGGKRGIQQIVRDRTWGTTLVLLTALMVLMQLLVVFLLGVQGVNHMLASRAAIQMEVLPGASDQNIQEFYAALRAEEFIQDIEYVPREQAYQIQRERDPDLVAFLEEYKLDNPFPDIFRITLSQAASYDTFVAFVQREQWRQVVDPSFLSSVTEQEQEVRSLLNVTGAIRMLTFIFLIVAFIVLCFVILEWVSRTTQRRGGEVMLESLLGAPAHAVLLPFVAEMALLLLGALLLGSALVLLFTAALPAIMPAIAMEEAFQAVRADITPLLWSVFPVVFIIEAFVLPLLALAGTMIGARGQLR